MVDFGESGECETSLDQDVFQYMTDNKMYSKMTRSNDENIAFAILRTGQSLVSKASQENMNVNELPTPVNQKDATFTIHVNETVVGLVQCNKIGITGAEYRTSIGTYQRGSITYGSVDAATRKTTRTKKVSR